MAKHFPKENISYKHHPNPASRLNGSDIFESLFEIDSKIPSELLFKNNFKLVITFASNALKLASQIENSKIICVMKLFHYFNENEKEAIFESMELYGNDNLLFPVNFEEFKSMILKCVV